MNLPHSLKLSLLAGLLCAAPSASAASVSYLINFTATSGAAPNSGTFTYDAAVPSFSAFFVDIGGTVHDFTTRANVPTIAGACDTAAANAADLFAVLSGTRCGPSGWQTSGNFIFTIGDANGGDQGYLYVDEFASPEASGTFTITEVTPEPSAFVLMLRGVAVLAWRRRNQHSRQPTQSPRS